MITQIDFGKKYICGYHYIPLGEYEFKNKNKNMSLFASLFGSKKKNPKSIVGNDSIVPIDNIEKKSEEKNISGEEKYSKKNISDKDLLEAEKVYKKGLSTVKDIIAPAAMDVKFNHIKMGDFYMKNFFVYSYPRYVNENWLSPIINMDATMDISMFIYPQNSGEVLRMLRKKTSQMRSTMNMLRDRGMSRDPEVEASLEDAEALRDQLQRGEEKFFHYGLYFSLYNKEEKELDKSVTQLETNLGSKLVLTKRADLQMDRAFTSCQPLCLDKLEITHNMNTSPLSSTFPFSSSDLSSDKGIMYGINRHNDSLIIFDRFSLPNANSIVLATSGAGKSYTVKLEMLRLMMFGSDVIVIDPENEYKDLCETVGGTYISLGLNSKEKINPFDLPAGLKDTEGETGDILRSAIINVSGIISLMVGDMTDDEAGILDRALIDTYAIKGITFSTENPGELEVPLMGDLHNVLQNMDGAESLATRIEKYVTGSYAGIFNQRTNIDLNSGMVVFNVRDLEEQLRPIAMHMLLNFIWNEVRSELKKRCLVVDEAWKIMQYEQSAKFLFGLVKRARKYYLGVTTISQDVDDFLSSKFGKAIVTNSAMQVLLKQSPSSMELLQKTFNLTEGEKYLLLNSSVGQGIFFAGQKHAAIQIVASYNEDKIITTNPEEKMKSSDKVVFE